MIFALVPYILQLALIIHCIKTNKPFYWIYLIIFIPYVGGVAYLLVELLPALLNSRQLRQTGQSIVRTFNPSVTIKKLEEQLENQDTVFYAAADALCTFLLATATVKYFSEGKYSAKFDNMVLYPLLHYENEKIWLDGDVLKNLYRVATERVDKMERDVYAMIGGQINLNSPVQVAQAFERLGIDTGERTSRGTMCFAMRMSALSP